MSICCFSKLRAHSLKHALQSTYSCSCRRASPDWHCRWAVGWLTATPGRTPARDARWWAGRRRLQNERSLDWGDSGRLLGKDSSSGRTRWPLDPQDQTLPKDHNQKNERRGEIYFQLLLGFVIFYFVLMVHNILLLQTPTLKLRSIFQVSQWKMTLKNALLLYHTWS